jgi:hypothetical protein
VKYNRRNKLGVPNKYRHSAAISLLCLSLATMLLAEAKGSGDTAKQIIPEYIYHLGGSEGRTPYETTLIKRLFEVSNDKFGPARLTFDSKRLTSKRVTLLINEGSSFHFSSRPERTNKNANEKTLFVSQPILNDLLGYRQIIVRRERLKEFQSMTTFNQLRAYSAGQASQWPDVEVLRSNELHVVTSDSYESLFRMLYHRRFDYLPLGAAEIDDSLAAQTLYKDELVVVDNIVLRYDWPIFITVTKKNTDLKERLEYAMDTLQKTGEFDQIFLKYFQPIINKINHSSTYVFPLHNAYQYREYVKPMMLLDQASVAK